MELLISVLGALLVTGALIDIVVTVVGVSGGHGVVSMLISRGVWRLFLMIHRRWPSHYLLRVAGPSIFVLITLAWASLLVVGWGMILAYGDALVPVADGQIGIWDRLDNGLALLLGGSSPHAEAGAQPWSLFARIARFTGLALASFGLAYVIPVVGSVIQFRKTARTIDVVSGTDNRLKRSFRKFSALRPMSSTSKSSTAMPAEPIPSTTGSAP